MSHVTKKSVASTSRALAPAPAPARFRARPEPEPTRAPEYEPAVLNPAPIIINPSISDKPPCPLTLELVDNLESKVLALPDSIPIADDSYPLAWLSGDPNKLVVVGNKPMWEVWDRKLSNALPQNRDDLKELVFRGEKGLIGLVRILRRLVERHGIEGALLEGKITRMMEAIDEVAPPKRKTKLSAKAAEYNDKADDDEAPVASSSKSKPASTGGRGGTWKPPAGWNVAKTKCATNWKAKNPGQSRKVFEQYYRELDKNIHSDSE
ncbi:hypothetical protein C8J56DRAFT_1039361 [Mycena floridula]|nr:hypothetical protein C8J56DRAFT_1039361 [Mycena floridula]